MLFGASMFSKKARDSRFVSWHQDAAYYGLDPQEEVTCWVGLTDADMENGCMRVMPGSHKGPDAVHEETYDPQNLLGRGQTIRGLDDGKAVYMPVRAGQFSMHHERTIHGSMPNPSARRRVGIAFFYMPTHVRSTIGRRTATLVRGTDSFGHWDPEPMPRTDLDPECMAFLRQSWARYRDPDVPQAAQLNGRPGAGHPRFLATGELPLPVRGGAGAEMSDPRVIFEQTSKTTGHPNEFRFE